MPKHNTDSGLTDKQARFVTEYLIDGNAARSAEAAGYSPRTAGRTGSELLSKPHIKAAIRQEREAQQARTLITADRVLQEVARIAFFDIRKIFNADGTLKRITEVDDDTAAAISALEVAEIGAEGQLVLSKKFKAGDKGAALDRLMRHLGMFEKDNEQQAPKLSDEELNARIALLQRRLNGNQV